MVFYSDFPERVFEFAFNAEFVSKYNSLLATCPALPTQQEEKRKGYDVAFELQLRGGAIQSLFLQHKIVRFVDQRSGTNKHFYDFAEGPYFAFRLDKDQFNVIHDVATSAGERIYYCAPLYTELRDMNDHFLKKNVLPKSVWIDVSTASPITDSNAHSIVYSEDGTRAAVFSKEPSALKVLDPGSFELDTERRYERGFDRQEAEQLKSALARSLQEWWPAQRRRPTRAMEEGATGARKLTRRTPESVDQSPSDDPVRDQIMADAAEDLATYLGVTWLFLTKKEPAGTN